MFGNDGYNLIVLKRVWGDLQIRAAGLALAPGFRDPDKMRRSPLGFLLALGKGRLAQTGAEDWEPVSTVATGCVPEVYYPPEELERQRENTRRATEHATAYITAELEKGKRAQRTAPQQI
ncbi:hypothetical protein NKH95_01850 [Mesorhizobium sp. M0848]|uniref:hypothetical protein n=1 Tax=Mesorhizobium sp. M0848 TaxID=2957012 RepID=UPI00333A9366